MPWTHQGIQCNWDCRRARGRFLEGKNEAKEPSSLSLNETKTGTFPTKSEEGRLTFQKVLKKKAGSETRNRGCEGRGTSKHDVIGGEGDTKLDGTGVEGRLEPQEPGRWEKQAGSAGP